MIKFQIFVFIVFFGLITSVSSQDIQNVNIANEYFTMGEIDKAKEMYETLAKDRRNITLIHNNYFEILLSTGDYEQAEKYIDKVIKENPGNIYYVIDKGLIYERKGDIQGQNNYFKKLTKEIVSDDRQTRIAAQYLIRKQNLEIAKMLYLEGREVRRDPYYYALELATVYRLENNKDMMIREYLNFVDINPNNLPYVKNVLQNYLIEPEDLESFEMLLYDLIQNSNNDDVYSELLIWVNIQQRNFHGAFIQARALDLRKGAEGNEILEVGLIALENRDYESALEIFDFLTKQYRMAYIYPIAKRYKIKSREELVKNTYPVNYDEIRYLTRDYSSLVNEIGINSRTAEALLSKAHLHAFYLDEYDSAISILNTIVGIPRITPDLKAQCKLDLGDIYLLLNEPWESALLYAQVEKERKDTEIAYDAKLRSAKLSYYKGDFELAQEHLDVLKLATTRRIANDAMQLSVMIKDNLDYDTSNASLKRYANVELLLFQNKKQEALENLNEMYDEYKGTNLTSQILWLQSSIYIEIGEFTKAIEALNIIIDQYADNIFGDDALFRIAEIYDFHLKDKLTAQQLYQEFLIKYPGSYYTAESRKRFRELRGDFIN